MKALRWSDVDLTKRQLCVERSDWEGHVTSPKGGRLRYVPLTVRLAAALRMRRHLLRSGPRNPDSGLSEISIVFQAAVPKPVAPKHTTSGVRRPSEL